MAEMNPRLFVVLICCFLFTGVISGKTSVVSNVGRITGLTKTLVVDGKEANLTTFLGIPFAETTAGENRFKKPVPKAPFTATFDASQRPVACIQSYKSSEPSYSPYVDFTEDCLTLHVYVPHGFENNGTSLPVMIWIFGGGFLEGAAGAYEGDGLSVQGQVVIVTINYRVGMFGFLRSSDGQLVGNQGLWDQHLAIKWVHDNIAAFTGDPNKVTIFGQSAGGASVIFQALYPGNKGLFQRVIAESGSALGYWALMDRPNAEDFIQHVGCSHAKGNPVACIRGKRHEQLQFSQYNANETLQFKPIIDNDFLVASPSDIIFGNESASSAARDFFATLDITLGVNNMDGAIYVTSVWSQFVNNTNQLSRQEWVDVLLPTITKEFITLKDSTTQKLVDRVFDFEYTDWAKPNDPQAIRSGVVNLSCDGAFFYPAIATANGHSALGRGRTFVYVFSVSPSRHAINYTESWVKGSNHGDEIPFVLGYPLYDAIWGNYTDGDRAVAKLMTSFWSDFAKHGDFQYGSDQVALQRWPQYRVGSEQYIEIFNDFTTVESKLQPRRMALWSSVLPTILSQSRPAR